MTAIPSPLADAFAALAAELRARAEADTEESQAALHALVLLGLARVLWVLESMLRHWQQVSPATAAGRGHVLLAARYPRAAAPHAAPLGRRVTPRIRADLRAVIRPYQAPAPARRAAHVPRPVQALPTHGPARATAHPRAMPTIRRAHAQGGPGVSKPAWAAPPTHALNVPI